MATIDQIITRWVRDVVKTDGTERYLNDSGANVKVYPDAGGHRLYSYGPHFELARWVRPVTTGKRADRHAGFWLLNGDKYSSSTLRHQTAVRSAVQRTGAPVVILPHTPLRRAGIDLATILPVEVTQDRTVPRTYPSREALPGRYASDASLAYYLEHSDDWGAVTANPDGTYTVKNADHVLGESVFHASYETRERVLEPGDIWHSHRTVKASAYFLSAFDAQERTRHYFLAQLPQGKAPVSVKDAFEMLRPAQVKDADRRGEQITRQGDIFAVPSVLITRDLRKLADGAPIVKGAPLLSQRHTATEVINLPSGRTFARGTLTHTGGGHQRQKMGDGKTWHLIVKNTVPTDEHGQNRAWSYIGQID